MSSNLMNPHVYIHKLPTENLYTTYSAVRSQIIHYLGILKSIERENIPLPPYLIPAPIDQKGSQAPHTLRTRCTYLSLSPPWRQATLIWFICLSCFIPKSSKSFSLMLQN